MIMADRLHGLIHKAKKYEKDLQYLFPVKDFHIVSLRDDAGDNTRDRATRKLRRHVRKAEANGGRER